MARQLDPTTQTVYAQLFDTLLVNQMILSADGARGALKTNSSAKPLFQCQ